MTRLLPFLLVLCVAAPVAAQTTPQNVRISTSNGQSVAVVTNTSPGTSDYGLAVRCISGCSGGGGAATEATLAKLTQTQGSTTSGQSGPLVQGAVTTAAPAYTTGQTSPLSLTTAGELRVSASSTGLSDGAATAFTNQQAVTASAVVLTTATSKRVCVRHLYGGTQDVVYVGPAGVSTATGFALYAGDAICLPVANENLLYVISTDTGSSVSVIGVN